MNRVKCIFENTTDGDINRFVVIIPEKITTIDAFLKYVSKSYIKSADVVYCCGLLVLD